MQWAIVLKTLKLVPIDDYQVCLSFCVLCIRFSRMPVLSQRMPVGQGSLRTLWASRLCCFTFVQNRTRIESASLTLAVRCWSKAAPLVPLGQGKSDVHRSHCLLPLYTDSHYTWLPEEWPWNVGTSDDHSGFLCRYIVHCTLINCAPS